MLGDIERVLERPGALLEGPRLTADGAALYSDVTGGGVYRDGDVVVPKRRGVGGSCRIAKAASWSRARPCSTASAFCWQATTSPASTT